LFHPAGPRGFAARQPAGCWQDFVTIAGIWVAAKFSPSHSLWPYPGGRLAYVFTVLLSVTSRWPRSALRRINGTVIPSAGPPLELFLLASLIRLRLHRHSTRPAITSLNCSALQRMEIAALLSLGILF